MTDQCNGCEHPRHYGQQCPACECRFGALLVKQEPQPLDCGHAPTPTGGCGTGYGISPTGMRLCYDCCRDMDLARMERGDPIVLYLTGTGKPPQGYSVTNWPGSLKIHPLRVKHSKGVGFYGRRFDIYDVWFVGPDNHIWHGRNQGNNQLLRCRPTKEVLGAPRS